MGREATPERSCRPLAIGAIRIATRVVGRLPYERREGLRILGLAEILETRSLIVRLNVMEGSQAEAEVRSAAGHKIMLLACPSLCGN